MNERTVTEKQVTSALDAVIREIDNNGYVVGVAFIKDHVKKDLLLTLFPEPFIPVKGQVIAIRDSCDEMWAYLVFIGMTNNHYSCKTFGYDDDENICSWQMARPLNKKERGDNEE